MAIMQHSEIGAQSQSTRFSAAGSRVPLEGSSLTPGGVVILLVAFVAAVLFWAWGLQMLAAYCGTIMVP